MIWLGSAWLVVDDELLFLLLFSPCLPSTRSRVEYIFLPVVSFTVDLAFDDGVVTLAVEW